MTQLRFFPATLASSAVLFFSSLSSALVAPPAGCGTGPACGVGFECSVVAESSCASAAPCAPGSSCPPPAECVTTQEYGCTPAHCAIDAECAPGMVCHAWTESCPVTDCACAPDTPNCGCDVIQCAPSTVSRCTPRYSLPCKVASDCGDGFTCEELVSNCAGGSSGSGPRPSGDAAPAPSGGASGDPVPVPECKPRATGQFQCVVKPLTCATDAQCPAGWHCRADVVPTAPACPPGSDCLEDASAPLPAESWCRPPYYDVVAIDSGVERPSTPTTGSGNGTGTSKPGGIAGASAAPSQPEAANAADASSHESSACQMGRAPASRSVLSLVTLLGALIGSRRRRARG